ncbi:ABC transporter permease [Thermanaerothrix daxensis]|uniref:ABC transporter permease n=1 Tax=Thermanaerothrix daxensis TaxID=869279 RepID=A0A0P6XLH3_9CHLR|nr:ABC transporter permease [Thermanaerothrix daxensis]KPL84305.1 ABC transporter permease [Thermanaerothrix daxensis]
MATTTSAFHRKIEVVSPTRQRVMGILFILLGLALVFFFTPGLSQGQVTTFGLSLATSDIQLPPWQVHTLPTLYGLAVVSAILGGIQLARGFGRYTNWVLGLVVGFFIFGFLVWAAAGKSLNLVGMLNTTLSRSVPITLGALSGILCERSGVVNIAIEGMMLTGAMVSALVGSITQNAWIGLLAAIFAGALLALIHAVLSIKYKTNQIVSGTVINIFATGLTSYISAKFLQVNQALNNPPTFGGTPIPLLSEVPILGPVLFNNSIFVYVMFVLLIVLNIALFQTRWGLRLRAVGEHPKAADTLGIDVFKTRYMAVILGGMVAGFAGGYFTLGSAGRFDEVMTAGRGFIGLAAMIFGNWNPFGAFGAGLLFGFADALASRLAILGVAIPSQFLLMAPYIATMIVLAGVIGRARPPAADGIPYEKE